MFNLPTPCPPQYDHISPRQQKRGNDSSKQGNNEHITPFIRHDCPYLRLHTRPLTAIGTPLPASLPSAGYRSSDPAVPASPPQGASRFRRPEAKRLLRDLVNTTIGVEALANQIHKPAKSLHRMLSASRRPSAPRIAMMLLSCGLPCPESSR